MTNEAGLEFAFKDQDWFQSLCANLKTLHPNNRQRVIDFVEKLVVEQDYTEYYEKDCAE